jgi:tetratricopeptide (TPR) repeat protein
LALFQAKKFNEGSKSFSEAEKIAKELDDYKLLIRCLGIKTIANQLVGRLPTAYKIAGEIETLADEHQDLGVKFDSLASQGQILIESGDELTALEKLSAAQEVVDQLDDPRRQMNLKGAFGNYSMTIASPEKALAYFEEARVLAQEIGDRNSEIGFHGNIGTILEWKGDYHQAAEIFQEVLTHMREIDNQGAEIQALRHLTQVYTKLEDDVQITKFASQGVELAKITGDKNIFNFYEKLIPAYYRLDQFESAHQAIKGAIEVAQGYNDRDKEVSFLLSLGESYMLTDMLEDALETYQQALDGTQRLQRMVDRAYLLGRIGVILAELGRIEEALGFHKQAIEQAKNHEIVELEAEQSVMLAMAYFDQGNLDQARSHCETAVKIYEDAKLTENAENARQLLAEIKVNISPEGLEKTEQPCRQ